MVREGSPSSAILTLMRPAKTDLLRTVGGDRPGKSPPLSVNNGSCTLPLVSDDIVVVTDAARTSERFGAPSSSTRKRRARRI